MPWREPWGLGFFVAPLPLAAVVLTALNDHVLKTRWPSFVTGKLSDFAGLFFFPLFTLALVRLLARGRVRLTLRVFVIVTIVIDLVFALVKLDESARDFYVNALTSIGFHSRSVGDPTDLVAMALANVATYLYVKRSIARQ